MLINIKNVIAIEGGTLPIDESITSFNLEDCNIDDICAAGNIINNAGRVELNLSITFTASSFCARCNMPVKMPLTTEINEPVSSEWIDNTSLKLTEVVTSEISLQLPLRFLCSSDCQGLCDCCGANLNNEKCSCDTEIIDERLLKLKQLLEKED